ncbi:peptidoglycan-binding domain-containing protein [Microcoleus sp. S13_C5]|uniref:peptidoglycan-binding domain-containing protein n=1 Tax=Microcoleus sp. S13_C5 TaxID=3055411 RepID=UPI002FD0EA84
MISRLSGKPAVIFSTPIRELAILSLGDRGNSVSELQPQLKQLGYYKTEITRIYGKATADAVARISKKYSAYFADQGGVKWLSCLNQLDSGWGVIILQEEAEVLEKGQLFWQFAITIAALAVLGVGGLM